MIKGVIASALLVFLIASIKRPAYAVSAVLCMFVMEQWAQASDSFFLINNQLINIGFGVVVLVGFLASIVRFGWPFRDYPAAGILTFTFFIYCFISTFWAPEFQQSFQIFGGRLPYIVTFLLLPPLMIKNREDYRAMIDGYIFIGSILAFLLLVTVDWTDRTVILGSGKNLTKGNPLEIGTLGGAIIVTTMLSVPSSRSIVWKISMYVFAFIALVLLVKSGSRGQLVAAVASLMLFWPICTGKGTIMNAFVVLVSFAVFGALALIVLNYFWHGNSRWTYDQMSADILLRLDMASILISHWLTDPLAIFIGLGNSASYHLIGIYPHIVPIEVLTEEGFIGFFIYFAILLITVRAIFKLVKMSKGDKSLRPLISIYGAMFVYSVVLSLKQGSVLGALVMFFFAITVCKLSKLARYDVSVTQKGHMLAA